MDFQDHSGHGVENELLPNPFDYVPDDAVAGTVAALSRASRRSSAEKLLDDVRRAAEAALEAARLEAASILWAADEQAAVVAADAAAKRDAAVSLIDRSTRGVEELLRVAVGRADGIRRQAERARRESQQAAAVRRDAAEKIASAHGRNAQGRESGNTVILDLDRESRVSRQAGTGGLDSALGRAVHKAFEGSMMGGRY